MTKTKTRKSVKSGRKRISPYSGQTAFAALTLFSLALVMINPESTVSSMTNALHLCAEVLIPSLFPFMAISDILVRCGGADLLGRILHRPMRALFGVSGEGAGAVLLGFISGFPIGARAAFSLYSEGRISKNELERLLSFSNIPSSAFIINAVGISLFGSRSFGIALYMIVLISALATGILQRLAFGSKRKRGEPTLSEIKYHTPKKRNDIGIPTLTASVCDSALGMLKVCAFVLFFNALVGALSATADALSLPQSVRAFVFGFFELTGGISAAAELAPNTAALLAALFAGWSGLSVHLQIISLCPDGGISFKPYLAAKLFQGLLCAALMQGYISLASPKLTASAGDILAYAPDTVPERLITPMLVVFLTALTVLLVKRFVQKQ